MFWTIAGFLIVLGIVIIVHELGHYWAARIAGVRVRTFSIGFGRAIVKWTAKGGTVWKIALLPLGGYVSLYGHEDIFDRKKFESLPPEKKKGHYLSASGWMQAMISAAGVILNFVLAFVIYTVLSIGWPRQVQLPVIGQVIQNSVAYNAGVRAGDVIARIDGAKIGNWGDIIIAKELAASRDAKIAIIRGEKLVQVQLSPAERWGLIADGAKTEMQRKNIWTGIRAGAREVWIQTKTIITVLKQIITGERSSKQLGSFILIAQMSGQALAAGIAALLSLTALLSINLGILNLLPLPVLDGGHLLIRGIEGITRRKLQGKAMEYIFISGWIFIGLLFIMTMKNDIFRVLGW
ncbi:MAG: M50 family metallopeptidase [Alphaproteobacteria bacterium]|nr:M50 family metallopeptidase [Alphaproteobacteria bacterium]